MILKKMKRFIGEFRSRSENLKLQNEFIKLQNAELEWAHIYHDTINGKEWLKNLSISPGRWAGNYSFFYVLVRILSDYKPKSIIEFGLGESSKVVSKFLENELQNSTHTIVEQDTNWISGFKSKFVLSSNSEIIHIPLVTTTVKGFQVRSYNDIQNRINKIFDFYIVDGPFGSTNFSRYDICLLAEKLKTSDEFIILIDDYDREGERETAIDLLNILAENGIKTYTGHYYGNKGQLIISTGRYRYATSI